MIIRFETDKGLRRLRIEGDMNIYSAPELKRQLLDHLGAVSNLEVNLSQVGEMDTAGFQVLYLARREAARNGKTLRLASHSPAVLEVMNLYNMAAYFGEPAVISRTQKKARAPRHKLKAKKVT